MPKHIAVICLLTALCWLGSAQVASAQESSQGSSQRSRDHRIQGIRVDVHGNLAYYGAMGAGFRIDIPIVPHGFLHNSHIQDELAISPGLDLFFFAFSSRCYVDNTGARYCPDRVGFGIWPVVMAQWNLYLTRSWSVFPELGVAFVINDHNYRGVRDKRSDFYVTPAASIGARWHFSRRNSLLFRLNFPAGFQIGLTF